MKTTKFKVYLDADDTILNTSEVIINILNKKCGNQPPKTFADLKDWGFNSIDPTLTEKELFEIFSSDEFWNSIQINPTFKRFCEAHKDDIEFCIVTKGDAPNLARKRAYFVKNLPIAKFIGLDFNAIPGEFAYDKSMVDMSDGIQIDDRCDCLKTNAKLKILITNGKETKWNNPKQHSIYPLYIARDLTEIAEILEFYATNPDMLESVNV